MLLCPQKQAGRTCPQTELSVAWLTLTREVRCWPVWFLHIKFVQWLLTVFVLRQECLWQYNSFCMCSHIYLLCCIICLSFIIICLNWLLSFFLASAWEEQNAECLWLLVQIFWCVFMLCCWVCNSWRSIVCSKSRTCWTACFWRYRHYSLSKRWDLHTQQNSMT